MKLNYRKSESTVYPVLVDTESSKTTVFLRRKVEEKTRTDPMSEATYTYYEYEEAKLSKNDYTRYLVQKQIANTDYSAIISGIDLEECEENE